ncbi:uncharacterized protein LOC106057746 isoform X1 [Biomphalaria glabrata]|uniref:Uncharacterized protein LOC106057746 isoform X1 n=2 Tax=Biomphalaria glabrata TaxID=6526 RepID=A0A9W2ZDG4_BIOGL|nr:uncharacterized protein LOC106057746 isoform X1 [Biomphalaria glabrata]
MAGKIVTSFGCKKKMSEVQRRDSLKHLDTELTKRLYNGNHEMEVCDSEADLLSSYIGCTKNPEHASFIPVNNFSLEHLPAAFQEEDIVQVVKALAELTVRVRVNVTSLERPMYQPDSDVPYPFYNFRGRTLPRFGTGLVDNVTKYEMVPCPCQACRITEDPKEVWAEIEVFTASHVVFDESEASSTCCRLFYDYPGGDYVDVNDVKMWHSDVTKDKCRLTCLTHDEALIDRLLQTNAKRKILCRRVRDRYWNSRDDDKLTIIVSHPHGCQKMISVGEWRQRTDEDMYCMYTYNTATCPGSSGAYVYILGSVGWWYEYVHRGVNLEGTNFSGAGYDPDFRR